MAGFKELAKIKLASAKKKVEDSRRRRSVDDDVDDLSVEMSLEESRSILLGSGNFEAANFAGGGGSAPSSPSVAAWSEPPSDATHPSGKCGEESPSSSDSKAAPRTSAADGNGERDAEFRDGTEKDTAVAGDGAEGTSNPGSLRTSAERIAAEDDCAAVAEKGTEKGVGKDAGDASSASVEEEVIMDDFEDGTCREASESVASSEASEASRCPTSLEGSLFYRRKKGLSPWRRCFVVLNLKDGGSICVYESRWKLTKIRKSAQYASSRLLFAGSTPDRSSLGRSSERQRRPKLRLDADLPWIARVLNGDASSFVIELALSGDESERLLETISLKKSSAMNTINGCDSSLESLSEKDSNADEIMDDNGTSKDVLVSWDGDEDLSSEPRMAVAAQRRVLKFYFKCPHKAKEMALWAKAFSKVHRLHSTEQKKKRSIFGSNPDSKRDTRIRSHASARMLRDALELEQHSTRGEVDSFRTDRTDVDEWHRRQHDALEKVAMADVSQRSTRKGQQPREEGPTEHRVRPSYAYPGRFMTHEEMKDDMLLPSATFHDDRMFPSKRGAEIGVIRVEILQCFGLPSLSGKNEKPDTVVYCVCGSYAFSSDVIPGTRNPIWLSKMRRACIFPVFHAYARLYLGVFDDDGKKASARNTKNDFVGRIVLDVSRFRPSCAYDITVPLRISSHVYYTRQRGAIRLRIHLSWTNEKKALWSYLPNPKTLKMPTRPNVDVSVRCCDPKAFRNVTLTVHGPHMPGKYSTAKLKGAIKEANFTKIVLRQMIAQTVKDTVTWSTPAISCFVFLAWMHCSYQGTFSLAPPYFVCFMLLHLLRNYAAYGICGPAAQQGFLPLTMEEMFMAATMGAEGSHYMRPLDMCFQRQRRQNSSSPVTNSTFNDIFVVTTHRPRGGSALTRLLVGTEEDGEDENPRDCLGSKLHHEKPRHCLEFPYDTLGDYPKIAVKDSLVSSSPSSKNSSASAISNAETQQVNTLHDDKSCAEGGNKRVESGPDGLDTEVAVFSESMSNASNFSEESDDGDSLSPEAVSRDRKRTSENKSSFQQHAVDEKEFLEADSLALPDQNHDMPQAKKETTLSEELLELQWNLHKLTFHLFHDQAYVVKDHDARFRRSKARRAKSDSCSRELDKIIGTGAYCRTNPVFSRIGPLLEPVVSGMLGFLCLFRTIFNIFTWQDPFMSFWTVGAHVMLITILVVFPWQRFLFMCGIVFVGPQNWIICKVSKHVKLPKKPVTNIPKDDKDFDNEPVFHCHAPANQFPEEDRVQPHEVQHVVVPYSPLMYQRFYDWPPERQYVKVTSDILEVSAETLGCIDNEKKKL